MSKPVCGCVFYNACGACNKVCSVKYGSGAYYRTWYRRAHELKEISGKSLPRTPHFCRSVVLGSPVFTRVHRLKNNTARITVTRAASLSPCLLALPRATHGTKVHVEAFVPSPSHTTTYWHWFDLQVIPAQQWAVEEQICHLCLQPGAGAGGTGVGGGPGVGTGGSGVGDRGVGTLEVHFSSSGGSTEILWGQPGACTGFPTSPSAHAKVTLPHWKMSFWNWEIGWTNEQPLIKPVASGMKYNAPPPSSCNKSSQRSSKCIRWSAQSHPPRMYC